MGQFATKRLGATVFSVALRAVFGKQSPRINFVLGKIRLFPGKVAGRGATGCNQSTGREQKKGT
jgi:hypothetical protein